MPKDAVTIQEIQHTLQHMQVIRFSVPDTPGMGHQATTLDILNYIISLLEPNMHAFSPTFEIIYKGGKAAEGKLASLFGQPSINSDLTIQYQGVTVRFIHYLLFKNRLAAAPESIATADLLLIGGEPPSTYSDILKFYKAQHCTGIPAYRWANQEVGHIAPLSFQRIDAADKTLDMAIPVKAVSRDEAALAINSLPASTQQMTLCRLFELFESDNAPYRQLVYGLAQQHRYPWQTPTIPREFTLASLAIANLKRELQAPTVMLFVNKELAAKDQVYLLQQMFNQGKCVDDPTYHPQITVALNEELAQLKTSKHYFHAYDITDSELLGALAAPQAGHVYMVRIPTLPKSVMQHWSVNHTNKSLPSVVEGANSLNLLLNTDPAKQTVPPYFLASYGYCDERSYPNQNEEFQKRVLSPETQTLLNSVVQALCPDQPEQLAAWTSTDPLHRPPNVFDRFITEYRKPNSELNSYFKQAAEWHVDPAHNKLAFALQEAFFYIKQAQQQAPVKPALTTSEHDAMCATVKNPSADTASNITDVPATLWCNYSTPAGLLALNPKNKAMFMAYMQAYPNASMLVDVRDIPAKWATVDPELAMLFREPTPDQEGIPAPELVLGDALSKAIYNAHLDLEKLVNGEQTFTIEQLRQLFLYAIAFNHETAVDHILKHEPSLITRAEQHYSLQHTNNPFAVLFAFGGKKLEGKIGEIYFNKTGYKLADDRAVMEQLVKFGTRPAYERNLAKHQEHINNIHFIQSALGHAINYGNIAVVEPLLKIAHAKNTLNIYNLEQLCSRIYVNLDMLKLFLPYFTPAQIEQSNIISNQLGLIEKLPVVKLMVEHGVNLNALKQYSDGSEPLYFAVGNEDMLAELILLGADLSLKNQTGISPLGLKHINDDLNLALVYELLTLKNPEFAAKLDKSLFATPTTNTVHNDATELPRCIIAAEQGVSKDSALWNSDHQVKNADTRLHDTEQSTFGFTFFDPRNKQYADICINPLEVNALNPSPFSQAMVGMFGLFGNPDNSENTHQTSQNSLSNSH
ncbi:MAG: hypothetical protein Tsb005_13870 [Gammaproteobacteria bacterium]